MAGAVVTILFTDLVGSTEHLRALGEDEAGRLRRKHFAALRDALAAHGGEEVKTIGDSLMAVFSSPAGAVAATVDMQQRTDQHNRSGEHPLLLRIGLNAGEATQEEGDYFGTPVVIARRLCDRASAGQILTSELIRGLVGARGFTFNPMGAVPLKGIDDPVGACEVAWEPAEGGLALPPLVAALDPTPFVGRTSDLERLRAAFDRARTGLRTTVMIAGEHGIGKTRLAFEAARAMHAKGAVVIYGRSDQEPLVPYRPFIEALRFYVESQEPDALRRNLGPTGSDLVRLVPQLAERLPSLGEPVSARPGTERYRLYEGVNDLLSSASREAPIVMLLDDLQWADRATLMLLRHLVRAPDPAALLLIGTYRDVELERAHPLLDTLADLRRERGYERIALRGLSLRDVERLLQQRARHILEPRAHSLIDALHIETDGNPFYLREIMRHLIETGAIYQRDGKWRSDLPVEEMRIPEGIREVIGYRLGRLSETSNDVLRVAACVGREFAIDVLTEVGGWDIEDVLDSLQEAVVARVVKEVPGTLDRFAFAHAIMRETLYEELTTSKRVRLHRRIGQALELLCENEPPLAEIAHHYFESAVLGDQDDAIDRCLKAGVRAIDMLAHEEAVGHFERALQIEELKDARNEAQRCDLMLALAAARYMAGELSESRAAYRVVAELARDIGDPYRLAAAALGYSGLWIDIGVTDEYFLKLLEESRTSLPEDDTSLAARLLGRLAMELSYDGDAGEREGYAGDAVEMARRLRDPATVAYTLLAQRHAITGPADLEVRLATTREALTAADRAGEDEMTLRGLSFLLVDLMEAGDVDEADATYERFAGRAQALRQPQYMYIASLARAARATMEGRFEEAEQLRPEALEAVQRSGRQTAELANAFQWLLLRWEQGRLDEARDGIVGALSYIAEMDPRYQIGIAQLQARLGEHGGAREAYERAIEPALTWHQSWWSYLMSLDTLVDVAAFLGETRHMPALYDKLAPYAGLHVIIGGIALVHYSRPVAATLGVLAAGMERLDDAVAHFDDALNKAEHMRAIPCAARIRTRLAATLLRRDAEGDDARAHALIAEAADTAARVGMPEVLREARALSVRA